MNMPSIENEDAVRLKKRRPERQLYVPPAQRRSSIKDNVVLQPKSEHVDRKNRVKERNGFNNEEKKKTSGNILVDTSDNSREFEKCASENRFQPVTQFSTLLDFLISTYFLETRCECEISENYILKFKPTDKLGLCLQYRNILGDRFTKLFHFFISEISIIQFYASPLVLDSLENIFLWKTLKESYISSVNNNSFRWYNIRKYFQYSSEIVDTRMPFCRNFDKSCLILDNSNIFSEYNEYFIKNNFFIEKNFQHIYQHHFLWENLLEEKYERDYLNGFCDQNEQIHEISLENNSSINKEFEKKIFQPESDMTIIRDARIIKEPSRIKNSSKDLPQNHPSVSKRDRKLKVGDHEEELEIMRKTKENINRKIRPIIKYVQDKNDILNIDDIKDWEDLLDDDGEIKGEYLTKDERKEKKSIVKNIGNYEPEDIKQIEELEHMVELYDFPSSFKTNDLIQAFNNIDSEAMYIKWVDDTHAILVLGSLTQAMKAINLKNPLVKVRPMSLASKTSVSIAYKNDLKPAMKRPPTNLQTARRFITAHLGTKIGVSKERMAKERDDLRVAREMKKLTKQNERDAWEGNLKSEMH